jgi:uncharacterized protein
MQRDAIESMLRWVSRSGRKPMVLRGARQVGKTWLVRETARRAGRELIEINFERTPLWARHFASNEPAKILAELSVALDRDIHAHSCLLFLDEVQAAPGILAKLRWFAELMPELPVVAAGSLLDFSLATESASVPVGRIEYLHVEPMSFAEFAQARGESRLLETLRQWSFRDEFSPAAHERASELLNEYIMVGGMPGVVAEYVANLKPQACRQMQQDLITSFRDDFAKYAARMDRRILDQTLLAVAAMLGRKFVYAAVGEGLKQHQAKQALELLAQARVCHIVPYTAANGLPLGAEVKQTFRKVILLDIGLMQALLGTPAGAVFPSWTALSDPIRAQICEQLGGQQLRVALSREGSQAPLFYWQREGGRPGEVDYLIQTGGRIVPVEFKSGSAGAMKSLHQFMFDKHLDLAVRVDSNPPSVQPMDVRTTQGDAARYQLLNVPHYLAWRIPELAATVANG